MTSPMTEQNESGGGGVKRLGGKEFDDASGREAQTAKPVDDVELMECFEARASRDEDIGSVGVCVNSRSSCNSTIYTQLECVIDIHAVDVPQYTARGLNASHVKVLEGLAERYGYVRSKGDLSVTLKTDVASWDSVFTTIEAEDDKLFGGGRRLLKSPSWLVDGRHRHAVFSRRTPREHADPKFTFFGAILWLQNTDPFPTKLSFLSIIALSAELNAPNEAARATSTGDQVHQVVAITKLLREQHGKQLSKAMVGQHLVDGRFTDSLTTAKRFARIGFRLSLDQELTHNLEALCERLPRLKPAYLGAQRVLEMDSPGVLLGFEAVGLWLQTKWQGKGLRAQYLPELLDYFTSCYKAITELAQQEGTSVRDVLDRPSPLKMESISNRDYILRHLSKFGQGSGQVAGLNRLMTKVAQSMNASRETLRRALQSSKLPAQAENGGRGCGMGKAQHIIQQEVERGDHQAENQGVRGEQHKQCSTGTAGAHGSNMSGCDGVMDVESVAEVGVVQGIRNDGGRSGKADGMKSISAKPALPSQPALATHVSLEKMKDKLKRKAGQIMPQVTENVEAAPTLPRRLDTVVEDALFIPKKKPKVSVISNAPIRTIPQRAPLSISKKADTRKGGGSWKFKGVHKYVLLRRVGEKERNTEKLRIHEAIGEREGQKGEVEDVVDDVDSIVQKPSERGDGDGDARKILNNKPGPVKQVKKLIYNGDYDEALEGEPVLFVNTFTNVARHPKPDEDDPREEGSWIDYACMRPSLWDMNSADFIPSASLLLERLGFPAGHRAYKYVNREIIHGQAVFLDWHLSTQRVKCMSYPSGRKDALIKDQRASKLDARFVSKLKGGKITSDNLREAMQHGHYSDQAVGHLSMNLEEKGYAVADGLIDDEALLVDGRLEVSWPIQWDLANVFDITRTTFPGSDIFKDPSEHHRWGPVRKKSKKQISKDCNDGDGRWMEKRENIIALENHHSPPLHQAARDRVILELRILLLMYRMHLLGVWEDDDENLAVPVTGGRFLHTASGCLREMPYLDTDPGQERLEPKTELVDANPGYSVLASGDQSVFIWIGSNSQKYFGRNNRNCGKTFFDEQEMLYVEIPPYSILIIRADMLHGGCGVEKQHDDPGRVNTMFRYYLPVRRVGQSKRNEGPLFMNENLADKAHDNMNNVYALWERKKGRDNVVRTRVSTCTLNEEELAPRNASASVLIDDHSGGGASKGPMKVAEDDNENASDTETDEEPGKWLNDKSGRKSQ